jgi:hypothetical protein
MEDNCIFQDPCLSDLIFRINISVAFKNRSKMASFGSPLKLDSKSVSETSVLVMTSLSEHLEKFRKFGYTTSPTFKYLESTE